MPEITEAKSNILNTSGLKGTDKYIEENDEDFEAEFVIQFDETYRVDSDYFQKQKESLEETIRQRIDSNSSAYIITSAVDELIVVRNNLKTSYTSPTISKDSIPNVDLTNETEVITNTVDELSEVEAVLAEAGDRKAVASIQTLDYNIGYIGQYAVSPVKKYFKIVEPYGFNKAIYQSEYQSKLLGIKLRAQVGDNIVSQWNGVVVSIERDLSNKMYKIKIYHGNSLYTEYSHVNPKEGLNIGAIVYQGELIGTAMDTSDYEPYLDNHIFYQIKIDGTYINPLLIYGTQGKQAYEAWMRSTDTVNLVEEGEVYYLDSDYSKSVEYTKDTVIAVNSDFNKDQ